MPRPRGATWRDAARTRASIVRRCVTSDVNRPTLWWYCGAVTSARFDERQVLPLAMFFGSPRALFPYYAERVFHVGPEGLGLLYASFGLGALAAAFASGWTARVKRQGLTILAAVVVWGASCLRRSLTAGEPQSAPAPPRRERR